MSKAELERTFDAVYDAIACHEQSVSDAATELRESIEPLIDVAWESGYSEGWTTGVIERLQDAVAELVARASLERMSFHAIPTLEERLRQGRVHRAKLRADFVEASVQLDPDSTPGEA